MHTFFSKLEERIDSINSLLCVGLDPHISDLSQFSGADAKEFCLRLIDATQNFAAAYKPNAAFFEALGAEGFIALKEIIEAIPDDIPVILDAKRGDIASTAQAYAKAAFEMLGSNAITISPYLGKDSVEPFIADPSRGIFLLCKTSNPGAKDIQDLRIITEDTQATGESRSLKLYEYIARLADTWNTNDNIGLVVGATQPDSLTQVRYATQKLWILAPGIGSQGGDLNTALAAGLRRDGMGMLIPVSRGISRSSNQQQAAREIRDAINAIRESRQTQVVRNSALESRDDFSLIADGLLDAGCIKFGEFILKSGLVSPIYIDLRRLIGFPALLKQVGKAYIRILENLEFDHLAALPYAALPITTSICLDMNCSMVYPRKEAKSYGTKAQIEGVYNIGQRAAVIDDLISTGGSKFEGIEKLESAGLFVEDVVVLIDRSHDGDAELLAHGYNLHSVMHIGDILDYYERKHRVDPSQIEKAKSFLDR
ncbi:MAG: orotidine-5'-phosphate decarboxylase [Anaerolineales bacterium]